jgi:branched-chain amino acid transport system substrate-binding protein
MRIFGLAVGALLIAAPAFSAGPVKIGMITTLSGGGSAIGIDVRDGFMLAVDQEGGKLGGHRVKVLIEDSARKPGKGKQIADRFVKRDKVDIMTGIIWSNIAIAVVPKVVRKGIFYISPNAGPSYLAGKNCHKNYFNASWQNDNLPEAMGQYLQKKGLKRVYLISVNYPAGKDMVRGFRRFYKGQPTAEVYVKLGQKDYAAEIAAVRNANPEAVFFFLPGGMGISFLKQWGQAGLTGKIALYGPGFSFDQTILKAAGKAALGVINSTQWNKDLPNAANKRFVADFKNKFGRLPSLFASQGYDTARLIASAIQAVGGDLSRKDDFREALRKADFEAVRGNFKFSANHHPIHDIYIRIVVEENGVITNKTIGKGMAMRSNAYIDQCKMK